MKTMLSFYASLMTFPDSRQSLQKVHSLSLLYVSRYFVPLGETTKSADSYSMALKDIKYCWNFSTFNVLQYLSVLFKFLVMWLHILVFQVQSFQG